jgi:hypothetical protein
MLNNRHHYTQQSPLDCKTAEEIRMRWFLLKFAVLLSIFLVVTNIILFVVTKNAWVLAPDVLPSALLVPMVRHLFPGHKKEAK